MTNEERKITILQAKELARQNFNTLPFETRSKLANGYDRLLEIEALLSKDESLCVATLKKRKFELEQWILEWYREQKI